MKLGLTRDKTRVKNANFKLTHDSSFRIIIIIIIIFFIHTLTQVNSVDTPDSWSKSTPKSGLKTIIITNSIFIFTQVDPPSLWCRLYPESTLESGFKIMIITTCVLILTQINPPDLWLMPYLGSISESDFKTIIIIFFIFILTQVHD